MQREVHSIFQFLKPFHENLWFAILITMAICGIAIALINRLSPYEYYGEYIMAPHDMELANKFVSKEVSRFKKFNNEYTYNMPLRIFLIICQSGYA